MPSSHENLTLLDRQGHPTQEEEQPHAHDNDQSSTTTTDSSSSSSNSLELKRLVATAATTAATLGYDVGIMAAAIQPIQTQMQLGPVQKEFAMGSLNFVAAVGALMGGWVANQHGRKPTVSVCCWLFVVGTISMALAPSYAVLLLGRIVTGLGVGVSVVVAPVFLAEVAPTEKRGEINTVFDVAVNGGILLGYVVGFAVQVLPLPESTKWRLELGLGLVLPLTVLRYLSLLPESPRWLVMANQPDEAILVLRHLGQCDCEETVQAIQNELEDERATPAHWCGPGTRLAVGLGFWQQITGTEAILYYSADFLANAGLNSAVKRLLGNVLVGLAKLAPELIAMRSVDRMGRRPLILASAVALSITTAALALAFHLSWSPIMVVILLCAVMASYSAGIGPFSYLVASESLGLSERATGMTLCAAANRCTSGIVALSTVSMYQALGDAGFFALYAVIGVVSILFYYTAVPETTGQSLEELAASRARTRHQQHDHDNDHDDHAEVDKFHDEVPQPQPHVPHSVGLQLTPR